ncbi:MAG: hypothetical protein ACD_20C00279G0006 [uncultured bacterium]|nr:MAG: hypothetical protein ACD_20C00279G0006 [uncultured bacterium]
MVDETMPKIVNKYNIFTQRSLIMSKDLVEILDNFKEICEFVIEDFVYSKPKREKRASKQHKLFLQ